MIDKLLTALRSKGLDRVADALGLAAKPSIRLRARRTKDADLAIGASRLGGRPDLPVSETWPSNDEQPMDFVAQINLSELPSIPSRELLPTNGHLAFFYDVESEAWGFDPKDLRSWRVLYFPDPPEQLRRTDPPEPEPAEVVEIDPCIIEFAAEMTIPGSEEPEHAELGLSLNEDKTLYAILDDLRGNNEEAIHRILGYSEPV